MLIGEAPGKNEDITGMPFRGRSGKYLDKILMETGIHFETFYITSVLKCFHPQKPRKSQVRLCIPWTVTQLEVVRPRLILVAGRTAESGLFTDTGIKERTILGIPCLVTCHPAAAMRFPDRDLEFRNDLKVFRRMAMAPARTRHTEKKQKKKEKYNYIERA